jgi:hypothetical protein
MSAASNVSVSGVLDYAALGFCVFPCIARSKEPATQRGFYDATTNPATIRRWFGNAQNYNIAVRTGLASGIWVLDVDGPDGAATLGNLETEHGALPVTLCSITSAGCHLWFRADDHIPSSAGRVGIGLDVRGDGGYVLAPPSVHPDGPVYRWSSTAPPAIAPAWLVRLASPRPSVALNPSPPRNGICSSPGAYGKAALEREIDALAKTAPGARNHALNRASFSLHQLVAAGELDGAEVQDRLLAAAAANGLLADPADGPRSVMATIRSGARAGMQQPRTRPIGGSR